MNDSRDMRRATDVLPTRHIGSLSPLFPRITYLEAAARLQASSVSIPFGANILRENEKRLTDMHESGVPVWLLHKPRGIEPFPYSVHPTDDTLTLAADFIAPDEFREILRGVAGKSFS